MHHSCVQTTRNHLATTPVQNQPSSDGGSAQYRPDPLHASEDDFSHFHMMRKTACGTWSDTNYGTLEEPLPV